MLRLIEPVLLGIGIQPLPNPDTLPLTPDFCPFGGTAILAVCAQ